MALGLLGAAHWQPVKATSDTIQDADVLVQFKVLPKAEFNLAQIAAVARRFLGTTASAHRVAVLTTYADSDVAAHEASNCEGSYRQWRLLYDDFPKVPLVAAQVISFGDDASLRLRTAQGAIQSLVLRGMDPTTFLFEGVRFEILHVTGRVRSAFEGCSPGVVVPVLYVRATAPLDEKLCGLVTSWLAVKLGKSVEVSYADDHWFPCDGRFPLRYPFAPAGPPLTEDGFHDLPGYSCQIRCDSKPACLKLAIGRPSKPR